MGDDYDFLCKDMLKELGDILEDRSKAAKTVKELKRCYTDWKAREIRFNEYRRPDAQ